MAPKRKSSANNLHRSIPSNKRNKSTSSSSSTSESRSAGSNVSRRILPTGAPYLGADLLFSLESSLQEPPADVITQFALWYQSMCDPNVDAASTSLFDNLNVINATLAKFRSLDGEDDFRQAVPLSGQELYLKECDRFTVTWRKAAMSHLEDNFQSLRHDLKANNVNFDSEPRFHELATLLEAIAPVFSEGTDDLTWMEWVPTLLDIHEARAAWKELKLNYSEFQETVYSQSEQSRLWFLVWRSLKLMNSKFRNPQVRFPKNTNETSFEVEKSFFRDPITSSLFTVAVKELGPLAAQAVEDVVDEYCGQIREAHETDTPDRPYGALSDSALSSEEERALNAALARKQISAKAAHLVQRAAVRLISLRKDLPDGPIWARIKTTSLQTPAHLSLSEVTESAPTQEEPVEDLLADMSGHDRYSAYDYVHYPFPETRALERAASEQIGREMREPGIFSDGPRVQHVVNVPPRHTWPPKNVSLWSPFRFHGPVGKTFNLFRALWRWRSARRRPKARTRTSVTPRVSLRERVSGVSSSKESPSRVSQPLPMKVPKLRGGGSKGKSSSGDGPGSPRTPSRSPPTNEGSKSPHQDEDVEDSDSDWPPNQKTQDKRLRQFREMTGNVDAPEENNEYYVNGLLERYDWDVDAAADAYFLDAGEHKRSPRTQERRLREFKEKTRNENASEDYDQVWIDRFLIPHDWNVEAAAQAYFDEGSERRRSRNVENMHRDNQTSPTPGPREPWRAAPASALRLGIQNTAPRPGILDDPEDPATSSDENSSSSSDTEDEDQVGNVNHGPPPQPDFTHPPWFVPLNPGPGPDDGPSDDGSTDDFAPLAGTAAVDPENGTPSTNTSNKENLSPGRARGDRSHSTPSLEDGEVVEGENDQDGIDVSEEDFEETLVHRPEPLTINEMFEIFEPDYVPGIQRGQRPSRSGRRRSLFGGPREGGQAVAEANEGADVQAPPGPRALPPGSPPVGFDILSTSGDTVELNLAEEEERWQREHQRPPLATLDERDPTPSSSPGAPNSFDFMCHPCPIFDGEYHHFCHCNHPLTPLEANAFSSPPVREENVAPWIQAGGGGGASVTPPPARFQYESSPESGGRSQRETRSTRSPSNQPVRYGPIPLFILGQQTVGARAAANPPGPPRLLPALPVSPDAIARDQEIRDRYRISPDTMQQRIAALQHVADQPEHTASALLATDVSPRVTRTSASPPRKWKGRSSSGKIVKREPSSSGGRSTSRLGRSNGSSAGQTPRPENWPSLSPGPARNTAAAASAYASLARTQQEQEQRLQQIQRRQQQIQQHQRPQRQQPRRQRQQPQQQQQQQQPQQRAVIIAQQYADTMFRDEMLEELEYRGITDIPAQERVAQLAQRLADEDVAGNLGMGNAYAFRVLNPGKKRRPAGYKLPPRPGAGR